MPFDHSVKPRPIQPQQVCSRLFIAAGALQRGEHHSALNIVENIPLLLSLGRLRQLIYNKLTDLLEQVAT